MKIVFFGTPRFGRIVLERLLKAGFEVPLVVSQPDRPKQRRGRGAPEPSDVSAFAKTQKLSIEKPAQASQAKAAIEEARPDVIVVAAYGQLLPADLLKLAKGRWLNVHASLLPAYRGASPVTAAILDGLAETGVTIMEVTPPLDAGPIVAQVPVPISDTDTTATLSDKLAVAGAEKLVSILPDYVAGKRPGKPQDDAQASVTKQLAKDDGRLDWQRDADYLARQIRAMQPWPGAWTEVEGQRLEITEAKASPTIDGRPGSYGTKSPLVVATGQGGLRIERLKLAGKAEMTGEAWLRGRRSAGRFG